MASSAAGKAVPVDLVLEGGGVKGLGTVGAVGRLLERGYRFPRVAGTSVGALAAAVVAAGVDAPGLHDVMGRLELERVPDRRHSWLPGISETVGLAAAGGVHAGDYIRDWLATELDKLGVATFGDLRRRDADDDANLPADQRYALVVTATDVTHGRLLRLPWDYHRFNLDPDEQPVADAVRMSLSIPFFFEPCTLTDARTGEQSTVVDGGVLSNFAVEIFDRTDGRPARWSTIGVRLFPDLPAGLDDVVPAVVSPFVPPLHLLRQVVATALVGRDQTQLDRPGVRERTIGVDTSGAGITQFGLDEAGQQLVRDRGRDAVEAFLQTWEAGR